MQNTTNPAAAASMSESASSSTVPTLPRLPSQAATATGAAAASGATNGPNAIRSPSRVAVMAAANSRTISTATTTTTSKTKQPSAPPPPALKAKAPASQSNDGTAKKPVGARVAIKPTKPTSAISTASTRPFAPDSKQPSKVAANSRESKKANSDNLEELAAKAMRLSSGVLSHLRTMFSKSSPPERGNEGRWMENVLSVLQSCNSPIAQPNTYPLFTPTLMICLEVYTIAELQAFKPAPNLQQKFIKRLSLTMYQNSSLASPDNQTRLFADPIILPFIRWDERLRDLDSPLSILFAIIHAPCLLPRLPYLLALIRSQTYDFFKVDPANQYFNGNAKFIKDGVPSQERLTAGQQVFKKMFEARQRGSSAIKSFADEVLQHLLSQASCTPDLMNHGAGLVGTLLNGAHGVANQSPENLLDMLPAFRFVIRGGATQRNGVQTSGRVPPVYPIPFLVRANAVEFLLSWLSDETLDGIRALKIGELQRPNSLLCPSAIILHSVLRTLEKWQEQEAKGNSKKQQVNSTSAKVAPAAGVIAPNVIDSPNPAAGETTQLPLSVAQDLFQEFEPSVDAKFDVFAWLQKCRLKLPTATIAESLTIACFRYRDLSETLRWNSQNVRSSWTTGLSSWHKNNQNYAMTWMHRFWQIEAKQSGKSGAEIAITHSGVTCSGCNTMPIIGERFNCIECSQDNGGVNLCGTCYRNDWQSESHSKVHVMCKLRFANCQITPVKLPQARPKTTAASSAGSKSESVVHKFICDSCRTDPIKGVRFVCIDCSQDRNRSFDLCEACEAKGCENLHPFTHPLLVHKAEVGPKRDEVLKTIRVHCDNDAVNAALAKVAILPEDLLDDRVKRTRTELAETESKLFHQLESLLGASTARIQPLSTDSNVSSPSATDGQTIATLSAHLIAATDEKRNYPTFGNRPSLLMAILSLPTTVIDQFFPPASPQFDHFFRAVESNCLRLWSEQPPKQTSEVDAASSQGTTSSIPESSHVASIAQELQLYQQLEFDHIVNCFRPAQRGDFACRLYECYLRKAARLLSMNQSERSKYPRGDNPIHKLFRSIGARWSVQQLLCLGEVLLKCGIVTDELQYDLTWHLVHSYMFRDELLAAWLSETGFGFHTDWLAVQGLPGQTVNVFNSHFNQTVVEAAKSWHGRKEALARVEEAAALWHSHHVPSLRAALNVFMITDLALIVMDYLPGLTRPNKVEQQA